MIASARRPRIAFLTTQYDHIQSGPGTFANYLRQAVQSGDLDLTIFSEDITNPQPYEVRVEIPLALPSPPGHFIRQWAYYQAFQQAHQQQPFDLLWYNSSYNAFIGTRYPLDIPQVVMVNDFSKMDSDDLAASRRKVGTPQTIKNRFWRTFEYWTCQRADAVIANSDYLQQRLITDYRLPAAKVHRLYKAVDIEAFTAPAQMPDLHQPLRVLFLKNHYQLGGLDEVLHALAQFDHPVTLTVAGVPLTHQEAIQQLAEAAHYTQPLHMAGRLNRAQVAAIFREHDVFCVPSHFEALGVSFMEAIASGIATIATDVGGIPEVLDQGKAGWLVPIFSPADITAALEDIIHHPEIRQRKRQHGLEHVQQFSYHQMLHNFQNLSQMIWQTAPN